MLVFFRRCDIGTVGGTICPVAPCTFFIHLVSTPFETFYFLSVFPVKRILLRGHWKLIFDVATIYLLIHVVPSAVSR